MHISLNRNEVEYVEGAKLDLPDFRAFRFRL
jgi:hypothetical protein